MKGFMGVSMRAKLFLCFGSLILFLAVVIAMAYGSIRAIQRSQESLYEKEFANAVDLKELRSNQNGIRAAQIAMILSAERAVHQEIKDRTKTLDTTTEKLLKRNRGQEAILGKLREINAIREAFQQTRETEIIPLIFEGKIEEAKPLLFGIQDERNEKMLSLANKLVADAEKKVEAAIAQSQQQAIRPFVTLGLIVLSFVIILATFPIRIILQMNRDIREGVNVLSSVSAEILASTTQVTSGAAEMATAVAETTTTVEEAKQTTEVASGKAKFVLDMAQKASHVSQTGKKSVEDSVGGRKLKRDFFTPA